MTDGYDDKDSNDVETAAALQRYHAVPWPDDEPDPGEDYCGRCNRPLLAYEGYLCSRCEGD
jgi:hypothetical protein